MEENWVFSFWLKLALRSGLRSNFVMALVASAGPLGEASEYLRDFAPARVADCHGSREYISVKSGQMWEN